MRMIRAVPILAFSTAVLFTSCAAKKPGGGEAKGGAAAPNFVLQTSDGGRVDLKTLRGKAVVVNFWATWCAPCRAEMPGMMKVYERLRGRGLEIVGISLDSRGWDDVRPYLARNRVSYPVVVGDEALAKAYNVPNAIPFTVFIDRKGNIVTSHAGYLSEEAFEQEVMKLL